MQADAYGGYDRWCSTAREDGARIAAACWAHARRKIHNVYLSTQPAPAEAARQRMGAIYLIAEEIRGRPAVS
ncbi:MAG: transposase [Serratia symbiotica]|nr:transposase [Serratia symbiotica]